MTCWCGDALLRIERNAGVGLRCVLLSVIYTHSSLYKKQQHSLLLYYYY